jgi:hypothetical protein
MKEIIRTDLPLRALIIGLAAIAPVAFPAAQAGYTTLHDLAYLAIIPAAVLLVFAWAVLRKSYAAGLAASIRDGAVAGAVATVVLEAVRYSGFRIGFMPGNLPELMGVLLFDRFALGPTAASTLGGFAYHFWNGACFGIIFALGRFNLPAWWAIPYGVAVGVGFLVSPVVQGLGVGIFGVNFGWHFAATVLTAHLAFGATMAVLLRRDSVVAATRCRSCGALAS